MSNPTVSVIMPVYNGEKLVREAIDSVLRQTLRDLELVIIDDGSTDTSADIAASIAQKDPRVRVIRNGSNLGVAQSLNKGLEAARGELIARADADDICLPGRLEKQVSFMLAHPEVGVCGCRMRSNRTGGVISYPQDDASIRAEMLFRNPIAHPAVIFKKSAVVLAGGYDAGSVPAEDYDLWVRLALSRDTRFANLKDVLVVYNDRPEPCRGQYYKEQLLKSAAVRSRLLRAADAGELDLHEDLASLFAPSVAAKGLSGDMHSYKAWLARAGEYLEKTGFCRRSAWKKLSRGVLWRAALRKIMPRKAKKIKILYYSGSSVAGGAEAYMSELAAGIDRDIYEAVHVSIDSRDLRKIKGDTSGIKCRCLRPFLLPLLLPAVLLAERPDIVHLNLNVPFSCFYMMFLLKLLRGAKTVATVHSVIPPRSRWSIFRWGKTLLCRLLFPVVDRFICVSSTSKDDFCRAYGIDAGRVLVVYNGVKPVPAGLPGKRGPLTYIGCAARLDSDKGLEYLIEAAAELLGRRKDLKLFIAGEGGEKKRLVRAAASYGISGSVVFAGYIRDKASLYGSMDIFVLPSLHESMPLTVLEAMSAGKPVVATAVGGIPEAVEDKVTGILVRPKDAASLVRAIGSLLDDPGRAAQMGARGKARYEEKFSFDLMIKGTARVYAGILHPVDMCL